MSRVLTPSTVRVSVVALVVVIFAAVGAALLFTNQSPAPQRRAFNLRVTGSEMTPDAIRANQGDTLVISIQADKSEEIHLHGYDKHFFASRDQPAVLTFPANLTGSFVLEIEASSTALGTLQVQPRGGLFGLGQAPDQSSTTVVKNQFAGINQIGSTRSYNVSLGVGPLQPMYTPAQVTSQRPKVGETMFSGQMVMPPGMSGMEDMAGMSAPNWYHLEVHFFDKTSGEPIKGLNPVITVTDISSGRTTTVPVVTMQGLTDGPKDYHYGNNIELPTGRYQVKATANDETGSFDIAV